MCTINNTFRSPGNSEIAYLNLQSEVLAIAIPVNEKQSKRYENIDKKIENLKKSKDGTLVV